MIRDFFNAAEYRISQAVYNTRNALAQRLTSAFNGKRDYYKVLGYSDWIGIQDYYEMYERFGLAQRIVRAFPQATWREMPDVSDASGSTPEESNFVEAWENLYNKFQLANVFERADRLASIGRFGLLFIGVNDGKDPEEPLDPGTRAPLLFLAPYSELNVTIALENTDIQSPRFGMPEVYNISPGSFSIESNQQTNSFRSHYSRVIHIAELLDENEIYGHPRLKAGFDLLNDLRFKIAGGSAETFWLAANRGLALEADKDAAFTPEDKEQLKEQAQEYQHQLSRVMTMQGVEVKSLGSDVPNPSPAFNMQLDLIAGTYGVPQRILTGSEEGHTASTQDDENFHSRIDERREHFASAKILRPFIEKMIITGNLPQPNGAWKVEWQSTDSMSPQDQANVLNTKMQAFNNYTQAIGGDEIITPSEFREMADLEPEPEGGFPTDEPADDTQDQPFS